MSVDNGVLMQYFQWYSAADGSLWNELAANAPALANAGITSVWIPPCYKGSGGAHDVGYGIYDLFDLGEFNQKGTTRTKYGTKDELVNAIKAIHFNGMQCYADVVFNHKDGGDYLEIFNAEEMDWENRNRPQSDWYMIAGYTRFMFTGRGDRYSATKWDYNFFDALTYNGLLQNNDHLYRIKNKTFSTEVSHEHENHDYLMANDLDTNYDPLRQELFYWGQWFFELTGIDGFRIDACKHIRSSFFNEWLTALRLIYQQEFFSVGEYWSANVADLHNYISATNGIMSLFDVPLHYRFSEASKAGSAFDMSKLAVHTLVAEQPMKAVTFVENHDSQPCQSLESPVEPWFKPLAYAFILLRREGYPCIFYADYYGADYPNCRGGYPPVRLYSHRWLIDKFLRARKAYGFGDQHDYLDHPNTIGWTRSGNDEHPGAMAVVMTNGSDGSKWMNVFRPNKIFFDITEHIPETITTNPDGWGLFKCKAGSVSVWLQQ